MYDNAMDIIQLVFGFVERAALATFLLGMFWKRTTGTGAFSGLFGGIAGSALFHSLTMRTANLPGVKGVSLRRARISQRNGAKLLARRVCVHHLFHADPRDFTRDQIAKIRRRLERPRLFRSRRKSWTTTFRFISAPAVVGVVLLIACVILNIIFCEPKQTKLKE